MLQEPPLHRWHDCRTCSPGRRKGAAGRRKAGLSPTSRPLPLDLCMTPAGRMTPDVARQRARPSVALLVLVP